MNGATAGLADAKGQIAIVSPTIDQAYAVPANLVTGDAKQPAIRMTGPQGVAAGLLTEGMVCRDWTIGLAATNAGKATDPQVPETAVVVHDLHGVVRTNYYDDQWLLLRSVNSNNGETTNYNYANGTVSGIQYPSGERICQQSDGFGKPLQVTKLPAPNLPGGVQRQVTEYSYSPSERLIDTWKDRGLASEAHAHLQRDQWDRITWLDTEINPSTTERTTFAYPPAPNSNPQSAFPNQITRFDGDQITLYSDPSGGGPDSIVQPVTGDTPRSTYATYDSYGRVTETGRVKHAGTVIKTTYDPAGLRIQSQTADLLNPGSFLSATFEHNSSRQISHTSDPQLDLYFQHDPYDHVTVEVDVPKDGTTASKSTCNHYSVDGRLEYTIDPEGIVTLNTYDDSGRLIQVDRGHPSKLSDWTTACLNGARAPGSIALPTVTVPPSGLTLTYQTPPGSIRDLVAASQLVSRGFALPQPATPLRAFVENLVSNILSGIGNLGRRFPGPASAPSPSWPSSTPPNDPGMQTVRIIKYAPGGFPISDADGSGVGSYFITDGFGRVIDQMNGDPAKVDPTQVVHRWRGYDTQDRVTWEAVVSGPNLPAYAKPQSVFPGLASMAEYSYDAKGRRIETDTWFFANGAAVGANLKTITQVTFDDSNRRVTTQIDQHPPLIQQSDELGRVTSETLPNGIIKTTLYSEALNGDTQTRTQPGPDGTPIVLTDNYNDQGLLLSTFQGQDERLHQEYDSYGRTTLKRVANSVTTTFGYDAYSRLISSSQAAAPSPDRENDFGYDGDDRKVTFSTVNATGTATTQAVYDGLDRLMSSQDPLKRTTTHDYYSNSFRGYHTTDPQGTLYTLNYDFAGRLTSQIAAPGKVNGLDPKSITRSFSYTSPGQMATAAVATSPPDAANGLQVTMAYDSMGNRILESTNGFLPVDIQSTFDPFGKPLTTNLVSPNGNTAVTIGRTFDELHRLATASLNQKALATLGYGGLGAAITINYGARAADPKNAGGVTTTIQYDFRGRATATDVANAGGIVASEHQMLGIDGIPRARSHRFGANGSAIYDAFEVDNAARLIKEAMAVSGGALPARELSNTDVDPLMAGGQGYLFYTLDGVANWTNVAAQNGATAVQVDPADEYTAFGNQAIVNTASGQAVAFGTNSYTFDAIGQLASATSNGNTVHFSYDALGRRVVETTSQPNQPDRTALVLWDGSDILATGSSHSDASGYRLRIGGNGLNSHLVFTDSLGSGAMYYVHQGPDNSVIALSNDSGLVEGYRYSAFGTTQFIASDGTIEKDGSGQPLTASSVSNRLLYQGQLQDPSIAGYAMRAREYLPEIGRFLSPDPAGQAGGDNRFAFVSGMPLTMTDPFGTAAQAAVDDSMSSNPDFNESNMPPPAPTCANCASSADQDVFVITHHNSTGITDFDVVPMGQIAPPQQLTNDAGWTEGEIERTIAQTNSDLQGAAYFVNKVMPAVIQVELAVLPIVGEASAVLSQVGVDVAAPEGAVQVVSNEAQGLLGTTGTAGEVNLQETALQIHDALPEGAGDFHTVAVGRMENGDLVSTISGGVFHGDSLAVSESLGVGGWVPDAYVQELGIHAEDQLLALSTAENPLVEIGVSRLYCPVCMDALADAGFEPNGGLTLILSRLLSP
ncbi:MAG: RHS repeat-associated core domain-containing protein [Candidatus Binataceae bacterium]